MPYAPTVNNNSGQILAAGISSAGTSIADAIDQYAQLNRQAKAYRTMAVDGLGMDPDEVDKMSLPQLQGKLQSVALRSEQAQRNAQIQMMLSHGNYFNQRGALDLAKAKQDNAALDNMATYNRMMNQATQPSQGLSTAQAMQMMNPSAGADPAAMARLVNGGITQPPPPPAMTPDRAIGIMSAANLDPEQTLKMAQAYRMMGMGDNGTATAPVTPQTTTLNGIPYVYNPRTGNFSAQPNPNGPTIKALPVLDAEGNPTGDTMIPHPNGKGFTFLKQPSKSTPKLDPAIDSATGTAIPGMYVDGKGNVHTAPGANNPLPSLINKGAPAAAGAAETAPSGLPLIKSRGDYDKLPKGALYKLPDGRVLKKGGKLTED